MHMLMIIFNIWAREENNRQKYVKIYKCVDTKLAPTKTFEY